MSTSGVFRKSKEVRSKLDKYRNENRCLQKEKLQQKNKLAQRFNFFNFSIDIRRHKFRNCGLRTKCYVRHLTSAIYSLFLLYVIHKWIITLINTVPRNDTSKKDGTLKEGVRRSGINLDEYVIALGPYNILELYRLTVLYIALRYLKVLAIVILWVCISFLLTAP